MREQAYLARSTALRVCYSRRTELGGATWRRERGNRSSTCFEGVMRGMGCGTSCGTHRLSCPARFLQWFGMTVAHNGRTGWVDLPSKLLPWLLPAPMIAQWCYYPIAGGWIAGRYLARQREPMETVRRYHVQGLDRSRSRDGAFGAWQIATSAANTRDPTCSASS